MPSEHQSKPFPLRLPIDLREWVEASAATNTRSINQEITHRLKVQQEAEQSASEKGERQNRANGLPLGHNPANR